MPLVNFEGIKPARWVPEITMIHGAYRHLWKGLISCAPLWDGPGDVDGTWDCALKRRFTTSEPFTSARWDAGLSKHGKGFKLTTGSGVHQYFRQSAFKYKAPTLNADFTIAAVGICEDLTAAVALRYMCQHSAARRLVWRPSDGKMFFSSGGSQVSASVSAGLQTGSHRIYVGSHQNGVLTALYENGVEIASATGKTATIPSSAEAWNICGGGDDKNNERHRGAMSMACYWNRALPPDEVAHFSKNLSGS